MGNYHGGKTQEVESGGMQGNAAKKTGKKRWEKRRNKETNEEKNCQNILSFVADIKYKFDMINSGIICKDTPPPPPKKQPCLQLFPKTIQNSKSLELL